MNRCGLVFLAALCVCLSCTTATDGGNGYDFNQNTVLGTLNLFVAVWNSCDIDTYEGLLNEDDFTFYFDPRDVDYGVPESWGYTLEIEAVTNLFDAIGAENIAVVLDISEVTEPEEGVDTYTVRDIPYDVSVYDEKADPEPVTYLASGQLDMELEYADGQWVITQWWDKALYRLLVNETTWGMIKARFSY